MDCIIFVTNSFYHLFLFLIYSSAYDMQFVCFIHSFFFWYITIWHNHSLCLSLSLLFSGSLSFTTCQAHTVLYILVIFFSLMFNVHSHSFTIWSCSYRRTLWCGSKIDWKSFDTFYWTNWIKLLFNQFKFINFKSIYLLHYSKFEFWNGSGKCCSSF